MQICEHVLAGHIKHAFEPWIHQDDLWDYRPPIIAAQCGVHGLVTDVEIVKPVFKPVTLHSVLGFCFFAGNNCSLYVDPLLLLVN